MANTYYTNNPEAFHKFMITTTLDSKGKEVLPLPEDSGLLVQLEDWANKVPGFDYTKGQTDGS